jgi:hypothetical protein
MMVLLERLINLARLFGLALTICLSSHNSLQLEWTASKLLVLNTRFSRSNDGEQKADLGAGSSKTNIFARNTKSINIYERVS